MIITDNNNNNNFIISMPLKAYKSHAQELIITRMDKAQHGSAWNTFISQNSTISPVLKSSTRPSCPIAGRFDLWAASSIMYAKNSQYCLSHCISNEALPTVASLKYITAIILLLILTILFTRNQITSKYNLI